MASKTKKAQAFGKFGAGYGTHVKKEYNAIEHLQRKRQVSPFHPRGKVKRVAAGIWKCLRTGKVFAGHAYHLNENK